MGNVGRLVSWNGITYVSGPIAGIGANYVIMAGVNSIYALKNGASKKAIIKSGLSAPWRAYKDISNVI